MAYDYTNISNTAKSLIDRFGRDVTLVTETQSGTSYAPTIARVETTIKAAIVSYRSNEIDGTLIKQTDRVAITYDEIVEGQVIRVDNQELSIVNVVTVAPGPTKVIFKGQLRK